MKYIGSVTVQVVQDAQAFGKSLDAATADVANRHKNNWHEWEFDRNDIGHITTETPSTAVLLLYQQRISEMHSGRPQAIKDLSSHVFFLEKLAKGELLTPPVLLKEAYEQQIQDGAHRIFAAYEYAGQHADFRLRVYWNRPP